VNRNLFFRILLGLVVVAVLVGAGFALFNAGAAYGLAQSGAWAERMGPEMMQRGMGWMTGPHMGWGVRPFGWGFGLPGFVFQILLFVGLIWLVSRLFFGWGRWGWRGNGGWEQRRQQMFDEWHKRAHEQGNPPQPPPSA
jgi:RsiW-degrading membrane proteinase PrsW (M82 family)